MEDLLHMEPILSQQTYTKHCHPFTSKDQDRSGASTSLAPDTSPPHQY